MAGMVVGVMDTCAKVIQKYFIPHSWIILSVIDKPMIFHFAATRSRSRWKFKE